jgi:hypothetical protein
MMRISAQWQEHKSAVKAVAAGRQEAAAEESQGSAAASPSGYGAAAGVEQAAASLLDRFEQLSVA